VGHYQLEAAMKIRFALCLVLTLLFGSIAFVGTGIATTRPLFHGTALDLDIYHAYRWSFSDPLDPTANSLVGGRPGLGVRLSYAVTPRIAPYAALHAVTHDWGNQDGTAVSVGAQLRVPWKRRVMPFVGAGVGHLHDSSVDASFDFAEVGGGVQLFVSRRLAFHPIFEAEIPLGDGELELANGASRNVDLDVNPWRASFGLTWFLGRAE
jgi:hypothetical protein